MDTDLRAAEALAGLLEAWTCLVSPAEWSKATGGLLHSKKYPKSSQPAGNFHLRQLTKGSGSKILLSSTEEAHFPTSAFPGPLSGHPDVLDSHK